MIALGMKTATIIWSHNPSRGHRITGNKIGQRVLYQIPSSIPVSKWQSSNDRSIIAPFLLQETPAVSRDNQHGSDRHQRGSKSQKLQDGITDTIDEVVCGQDVLGLEKQIDKESLAQ